jgi:hypothetical protein
MSRTGLIFIPVAKLADPGGGLFQHFKNWWWTTNTDGDLVFYRRVGQSIMYPQVNPEQEVCERLTKDLFPGLEVRQIPSVLVRTTSFGTFPIPKGYH